MFLSWFFRRQVLPVCSYTTFFIFRCLFSIGWRKLETLLTMLSGSYFFVTFILLGFLLLLLCVLLLPSIPFFYHSRISVIQLLPNWATKQFFNKAVLYLLLVFVTFFFWVVRNSCSWCVSMRPNTVMGLVMPLSSRSPVFRNHIMYHGITVYLLSC